VLPISAAQEAVVTATVSTEVVSVSVNPTSADYGTLPVGTVDAPPDGNPDFTVTNIGTVNEDFNLRGAEAVNGGNSWNLAATPGAEQYVHKYDPAGSPDTYTPLTLNAAESSLATDKAPTTAINFKLQLSMPTSFSGLQGQYDTTVTVVASKSTL